MEEKKRKQYADLYEKREEVTTHENNHQNRHRRTIEKICRRIAVSFLAMAVVLLSVLLHLQIKEAKEDAVLAYIRQEKEQLKKMNEESGDEEGVAILSEYAILYSMYPDVVGWLTVDGTQIDYPVMRDTTGNEYYLTHNFEGKEDNRGALFVSADSTIDPLDKNIVVFGHNVSDGTQFGELDQYLSQDFYQAHPTITFDTIYETGSYQIVAVVKTHVKTEEESGFRYYWSHGYENRAEFQELLDFIDENSIYDTGEHLYYGDTTVMLSTCEYTVDNGRLVIIAKRM
jgi:sortase B